MICIFIRSKVNDLINWKLNMNGDLDIKWYMNVNMMLYQMIDFLKSIDI